VLLLALGFVAARGGRALENLDGALDNVEGRAVLAVGVCVNIHGRITLNVYQGAAEHDMSVLKASMDK
jgi:hypothetical protein